MENGTPKAPQVEKLQVRDQMKRILQADAKEIKNSLERARIIYSTKNIKAAGEEVERAIRNVLRRKLPSPYYVGQGHIVDNQWNVSSQLDIIIADNKSPILFRGEDGTEYFPYESVYAIGEVKSTYSKGQKDIHKFVDKLAFLKENLARKPKEPVISVDHIIHNGGVLHGKFQSHNDVADLNPLFAFMIFVDSMKFNHADIQELYISKENNIHELPNVICLLDSGLIFHGNANSVSFQPRIIPEHYTEKVGEINKWMFSPFGEDEHRLGTNFGLMYAMLSTYLNRTVLEVPDFMMYHQNIFYFQGDKVMLITESK